MKRFFIIGGLVALLGMALFVSAKSAKADVGDEYRIFVNSAAQPGGNGTRERPYIGMNEVLNELRTPGNVKVEVWITGTFRPAMLDDSVSGTPEQPKVFMQWPGMPAAVFDAGSQPGSSAFSTNGADYITIRGLTGQNGIGKTGGLGFFLNGSIGVILEDSISLNNEESGVCTAGSTDVILRNNRFINNIGGGILVPSNTRTLIEGNVIENSAVTDFTNGIFVSGGEDITIQGNTVKNNLHGGIFTNNTHNLTVANNAVFGNNGAGVELGGAYGDVVALNNVIVNNAGVGIAARTSSTFSTHMQLAGNVLVKNVNGMNIIVADMDDTWINAVNNSILDNGSVGMTVSQRTDQMVRLYNNVIAKHALGAQFTVGREEYFRSDYNALDENTTPLEFASRPSGPWYGWNEWLAKGTYDTHSLTGDLGFSAEQTCFETVCVSYHLDRTSALVNAGKRLIGNRLTDDIDGDERNDRVDIGADEFRLIRPTPGHANFSPQ